MDTAITIAITAPIAAGYVAAIVYAVAQIIRTKTLSQLEMAIWVTAVILAPAVGALVWYFAGPHPLGLRLSRRFH
ncbi:PLDc N-terminal domain-containing protein [Salinibacterium sp. ZJ454]|uniref:PLDc N-terminal domain-containing protein n=1 Tax=Salinibacterium sp. ZJ454 TaxID=2708339 RepID=UPI001422D7C8|nr:PLDc N-terminal domain-containing protein [Salinibacterium sp. ZJ454]